MKNQRIHIRQLILLIICVTLAIGAVLKVLSIRRLETIYEPISTKESSTTIVNPFCGFYQLECYTPDDKKSFKDTQKWWQKHYEKSLDQLTLLEIDLKNYSQKNISDQALEQIRFLFGQFKTSKKQVILRFVYDTDGHAQSTEPHQLRLVKQHMSQLAAPVNEYKDCIYILQGLFIGNYGELHHSRFHSASQLRSLAQQMDQNYDPSIYLSVRTPAQLRSILQSDTPGVVHKDYLQSLNSRLGLFNDGMLGSDTDLGTYNNAASASTSYDLPQNRASELRYQNKLCQMVPNGGEVIFHKKYSSLMNAIDSFSMMHVSYLNKAYDPKAISAWQKSTYTGNGVFSGTNGYYYIKSHLGYRYSIEHSNLDFHSFIGDNAYLYLSIQNSGFAPAYKAFDTYLILTDSKNKTSKTIKTKIDNRSIAANDKSVFKIALNIRALPKGTYTLSLHMVDPYTKQTIHFANEGYENSGQVPVGTLTIK